MTTVATHHSVLALSEQFTSLTVDGASYTNNFDYGYTCAPAVYLAEAETPMFCPPSPSLSPNFLPYGENYEQALDACYYVPESYRGIQYVKTVPYAHMDPYSLDAPDLPDLSALSLANDDASEEAPAPALDALTKKVPPTVPAYDFPSPTVTPPFSPPPSPPSSPAIAPRHLRFPRTTSQFSVDYDQLIAELEAACPVIAPKKPVPCTTEVLLSGVVPGHRRKVLRSRHSPYARPQRS
ncbi:hypothetical protein IWQ60_005989 [Tieghemiomyces parasiticus]|uniref:Uncharacterized protein n=1 Tax=Tieghemiomyces parasiticus TaxID=78921 RepID=A0A9W8A5C9_9FUNG|nr:hypothetical protein IWQ60_005989 [Tieghemiomyces parasiticus]